MGGRGMWEVAWWRPGTWGGLAMRVGQVAFAGASIGVMASGAGFANYTAFWYGALTRSRLILGGGVSCFGGVDPCSVSSRPLSWPGAMRVDDGRFGWVISVGAQ